MDDFKNYCGCEEYPLLRTINRVLRNYPGPHPKCQLEKSPEGLYSNRFYIFLCSSRISIWIGNVHGFSFEILFSVEDELPPSDNDVVLVGETPTTTIKPTTTTSRPTTTSPPSSNEFIPVDVEKPTTCTEQFSSHEADCNKYYVSTQHCLFICK